MREFVEGGKDFVTLRFGFGETHVFIVEFGHVSLEEGRDSCNGGFASEGVLEECFGIGYIGEDGEVGRGWVEVGFQFRFGFFVCTRVGDDGRMSPSVCIVHRLFEFVVEGLLGFDGGHLGTLQEFGTKVAHIHARFILFHSEDVKLIHESSYDDACEGGDKGEDCRFDGRSRS